MTAPTTPPCRITMPIFTWSDTSDSSAIARAASIAAQQL
jgi:hypothetical protein